jgi:hypothetical protein
MPIPSPGFEQDGELPPPGSRWGSGAGSVLPYLTKSLQAKPAAGSDNREQRPQDPGRGQERPASSAA